MRPSDVIQRLDEQLQRHETFGQSSRIVVRVVERYKFALDVLSGQSAPLRGLVGRVEGLDAATTDALFGDFLVRAELETAIDRLEASGEAGASIGPLCFLLGEALGPAAAAPDPEISRRAMGRAFVVGPGPKAWVWDLPEAPSPIVDRLREGVRAGFMPGTDGRASLLRPTPAMVEQLDRACSLLHRLMPKTAESLFRHLRSIAIANVGSPRGRFFTGTGGDGVPCMFFLDPDEVHNPWDTACHILHEALHLKLADVTRAAGVVVDDGPVDLPWGRTLTLSNCVFAYHAYAHLQVFHAAVERAGPSLYAEYGAPHDYRAKAHAMSVVNQTSTTPFSRAGGRLRHFHEQLTGAWAPRLTPFGRDVVAWVWDTIRPLHGPGGARPAAAPPGAEAQAPPEAAPPGGPSAARYRQSQNVALRRSTPAETLFAMNRKTHKIEALNLAAWLAFELCDGQTERELLSTYASMTGLRPDRAWGQLAPTLGRLKASGMIVPAGEGAQASEGAAP